MTSEDKKYLEKIKTQNDGMYESDWLIVRLEAEAQENERLQQRERDLMGRNDIDVHEGMAWCDRAKAAEADRDAIREEWTRVFATLRKERDAAEATCQSLLDQSSRWEAQALEAGMCIAELEVKLKEYERFGMSIARAYGEGSISNTSEPQEGKP